MFERAKTVYTLDLAATVIGFVTYMVEKVSLDKGKKYFRPLKHWDLGFEFHSTQRRLPFPSVFFLS
jgi:hypothetical protein